MNYHLIRKMCWAHHEINKTHSLTNDRVVSVYSETLPSSVLDWGVKISLINLKRSVANIFERGIEGSEFWLPPIDLGYRVKHTKTCTGRYFTR